MDNAQFKQSVRTEIMGPAVEPVNDALNEALRRAYAELPERELTPMRTRVRGLTDAQLDDPRRGQGDRVRP